MIAFEEPGFYVACCDRCGERKEFTEQDELGDDFEIVVDELAAKGWTVKTSKQRFKSGWWYGNGYTETYHEVTCGDCK